MLSLEKCQSQENSGLNKQHPTCRLVKQPTKYPYGARVFTALDTQGKLASPLTMSGAKKEKITFCLQKVASPSNLRPVSSLGRASQVTTAKAAAPWSSERISWPFRKGSTTFLWGAAALLCYCNASNDTAQSSSSPKTMGGLQGEVP